jgi:uncharacterized membrane protein YphA (DoxX/SURF4 family)
MAPLAHRTTQRSGTSLSVALWVVQILLAALFLNAGFLKATQPIASIAPMIPWAPDVPEPLVRFIGVSELAGGSGWCCLPGHESDPGSRPWPPAVSSW